MEIPGELQATSVMVSAGFVEVRLLDGRIVRTPLDRYPTLARAPRAARAALRLMAFGTGVHWPVLDLQLSIRGIVEGRPEHLPGKAFARWAQTRRSA